MLLYQMLYSQWCLTISYHCSAPNKQKGPKLLLKWINFHQCWTPTTPAAFKCDAKYTSPQQLCPVKQKTLKTFRGANSLHPWATMSDLWSKDFSCIFLPRFFTGMSRSMYGTWRLASYIRVPHKNAVKAGKDQSRKVLSGPNCSFCYFLCILFFSADFLEQLPYVNDHDSLSDLAYVAGRLGDYSFNLLTHAVYLSGIGCFLALLLFTGMC